VTQFLTILTYHAIARGPAPLCIAPELFDRHLDALATAGCTVLTLSQAVSLLRAQSLPPRAVALTFDDGLECVLTEAVPRLSARGWPATVFCVGGHLGGYNDWPTQSPRAPKQPLASPDELVAMANAGLEIGSHTMTHAPLGHAPEAALDEEIVASRVLLESATGAAVRAFACPYGDAPASEARRLIERTYDSACSTRMGIAMTGDDVYALPRVDAHYVRRPELLLRLVRGEASQYLAMRRAGAWARRVVIRDFARQAR